MTLVAIDDDPASLELVTAALEQDGLEILATEDAERGLEIIRRQRPQIVLVDLVMPKLSGLEVLDQIMELDPSVEVILITAHYSTESAVQAIQRGASDYLNKPVSIPELRERVGRLIADFRRRYRAQQLDSELLEACQFEGIIGRSPLMLEVFARIRRVAPHYRTVLVSGPTGTGKELVARALHRLSPAATKPFVVCNCAAIPENLIESELFGHMRGAFTGATHNKPGMFELASEGVLFLDEIGEMPLGLQAKLLRAVQFQEIRRIGSPAPMKVNVRIVAASNRELRHEVGEKQFRDDLFYRLSMVEIKLPTLVDRKEDLPLLERHFVRHFAKQYGKPVDALTRRAEMVMARYPWPGNVRELENAIGYACMITDNREIDVSDLPEYLRGQPPAGSPENGLLSLDEMQRIHARRVLQLVGGDKVQVAQVLGVSRATVYRLLADKKPAEQ